MWPLLLAMQSDGAFVADKVVGILLIVMSVCLCGFMVLIGAGWMGYVGMVATELPEKRLPGAFAALPLALGAIVLLASVAVHVLAGIGIMRSAAWGFWTAIVVSAVGIASGGGAPIAIGVLVYSIMRLTGTIGTKPS